MQGIPIADIRAMTTGTDGDFVVKLIDVYPANGSDRPRRSSGYQLPIAMDIFRGRYRESFEHPSAIPANKPQQYPLRAAEREPRVPARASHHGADPVDAVPAVRPQSADVRAEHLQREAGGLRKAEITILRSGAQPSAVWLPVVEPSG